MATTALKGNPVNTVGDLPASGTAAPAFELVGSDLSVLYSSDLSGKRVVLNIFPSVDTGVCAASVRKFNELAAGLDNTEVVCVSADLPFAAARFCGAEGIENVRTGSTFRSSFGTDYGTSLVDGPMAGLNARAVVVYDEDGTVVHSQLVPEITEEPDYDSAIASLK
ncbi:thiol peroxidase [Dietzia timorensis]|uniref:Thiol peroxidase n=1 Tax=Dietzia timorensis TaxID=499555 RepID=A0A173LQD0_9ACTN|nr:thiol peroxidase [Dietzia timorensis]ANI93899.1 putative thiol peroxidase [Dietzia timorensis]